MIGRQCSTRRPFHAPSISIPTTVGGEDQHGSVLDRIMIDSNDRTLDPNSIRIYILSGSADWLDGLTRSTDKRSPRVQLSQPHIISPTRLPAPRPPKVRPVRSASNSPRHVVGWPRDTHLERQSSGVIPAFGSLLISPIADQVSSTGTPDVRNRRDLSTVTASAIESGVVDRSVARIAGSDKADPPKFDSAVNAGQDPTGDVPRVDGTDFAIAAFTDLSQDHFDFVLTRWPQCDPHPISIAMFHVKPAGLRSVSSRQNSDPPHGALNIAFIESPNGWNEHQRFT